MSQNLKRTFIKSLIMWSYVMFFCIPVSIGAEKDKLNKGRVDYFIYSVWVDESFSNNLRQHRIKQFQPHLEIKPTYMYLNKKHKALLPQLTQALLGMKKDGSYDVLVEKFLSPLSLNIPK